VDLFSFLGIFQCCFNVCKSYFVLSCCRVLHAIPSNEAIDTVEVSLNVSSTSSYCTALLSVSWKLLRSENKLLNSKFNLFLDEVCVSAFNTCGCIHKINDSFFMLSYDT
jgi:hypothetical protein